MIVLCLVTVASAERSSEWRCPCGLPGWISAGVHYDHPSNSAATAAKHYRSRTVEKHPQVDIGVHILVGFVVGLSAVEDYNPIYIIIVVDMPCTHAYCTSAEVRLVQKERTKYSLLLSISFMTLRKSPSPTETQSSLMPVGTNS